MSDTEHINEKYQAFLEEAKGLKSTLESLKKFNNIEDLSEKIPLTDFAQLNASLAYCLNSLYYSILQPDIFKSLVYMKSNGISFEEHRINQEIERIKQYFTKIQEVILAEETEKKNPLTVNKEAAERMIRAHLQDQFMKEDNSVLLNDDDENGINQDSLMNQENASPNQETLDIEKSEEKKAKKKQKLHKGSLMPSGAHLTWKEELDKMLK